MHLPFTKIINLNKTLNFLSAKRDVKIRKYEEQQQQDVLLVAREKEVITIMCKSKKYVDDEENETRRENVKMYSRIEHYLQSLHKHG